MDKLELLYDHYKETVKLSLDAQTKRNKLFVFTCLYEMLNFIMLLFPKQVADGLVAFIKTQYKIAIEFSISFFQCAIWIAITYTLVRYLQTMIYVERQYQYIKVLEKEISQIIESPHFDRESNSYLDKYPKVLDLIHIFYTWAIPLLLIIINLLKVVLESMNGIILWPFIFSASCCCFCVVLSILYLAFVHRQDKKR